MGSYHKWFFIIPVLIIVLGFYILLSGEASIKEANSDETISASSAAADRKASIDNKDPIVVASYVDESKINRESAYPYFMLGTGLLVVLLVLPKLGELSLSPTGGFTLKILNEAREAIAEAKTTAQAVEFKTKQALSTSATEALTTTRPDLTDEIKKLEENSVRLNAYADMLEKLMDRKAKVK